jgi:hypothetical protein
MARCFPQFPHNYNQVSREVMYNWFNKHLNLGQKEPVVEKPFEPVPPAELSVYDTQHPRPADAIGADELRKRMADASDKQIEALVPKDARGLEEFRRVVGTALRVMIHDRLPAPGDVESKEIGDRQEQDGVIWRKYLLSRKGQGEQVPAVGLCRKDFDGTVVVWVHPEGMRSLWHDGKLAPAAQQILDRKAGILAPDVLLTGEFQGAKLPPVEPKWANYAGYTYGYNRPLLANRVHDILTAVAFVQGHEKTKTVHLVGWEKAGPWALLARALCGDAVARTAADFDGFRFDNVTTLSDEMLLPGAVKYGGLPAFTALCVPGELYLHHHQGTGSGKWVKAAYEAAGQGTRLERLLEKAPPEKVAEWLLR